MKEQDGDGRASFEVKLDDIRKRLTDDLVRFERRQGMKFPEKPLDLKGLHVVGFVQDNLTKEVLQTVVTKVRSKSAPSP